MRMIFIHGPAAAGKYTVGRKLADALEVPLFHNHLAVDLVTTLFEFGSEPFVELREEVWLASFAKAARAGVSFIFTFQPEGTVRPSFIDETTEAVTRYGGTVDFVELICPENVVEQRINAKDRARFGKLRSLELYRSLRDSGAFEYPPMPEPKIQIPTHELSPEEAVERIRAALFPDPAAI